MELLSTVIIREYVEAREYSLLLIVEKSGGKRIGVGK
jgi:hypothetical protein